MVNVPPPLLCSTPPPIDFGEEDDDSGLQSTLNLDEADDEFSDYGGLVTETRRLDMVANDKVSVPHLMPDLELPQTDFAARPPDLDNCYVSCITPPPLTTITTDIKPKNLKPMPLPIVEAFNYDVSHNFSLDAQETQDFGSFQQQLDNEMPSNVINEGDDVDVDEEEATNNDNVNSLKLDSLSLYSSGSVSSATLSPAMPLDDLEVTQVEQSQTKNKLCGGVGGGGIVHQVTLEDVSDDSCDDDYSPKKRKSLIVNEDSEDFFAIHIVDDDSAAKEPKIGKNDIIHNHHEEESCDDKGEMQLKVEIIKHAIDCHAFEEKSLNDSNDCHDDDDDDDGFAAFQTTDLQSKAMTPPSLSSFTSSKVVANNDNEIVDDDDDDDDFGDFADFSLANQAEQTLVPVVNQTSLETQHLEEKSETITQHTADINKDNDDGGDNDDDFDDFQDFATASTTIDVDVLSTTVPTPSGQTTNSNSEANNNKFDDVAAASDDDDDFGDFSEASFASAATTPPSETKPNIIKTVVPPPPPPATANISITERVKPVLQMMFPLMISDPSETHAHSRTPAAVPTIKDNMHFSAIEQAKALDYQWTNSEMRFALIRSLGIDSRNILFSEKWNSNMPRFAANLSFDPIKPMKSQSSDAAGGGTAIMNTTSPSTSVGSGMSGSNMLNPTTIMYADDFDWKNGSVNPMSESHVQTLQLEQLDQLMMVANDDKINLDSSNYSYSSSTTCVTTTTSTTPTSTMDNDVTSSTTTTTTMNKTTIINEMSSNYELMDKQQNQQNYLLPLDIFDLVANQTNAHTKSKSKSCTTINTNLNDNNNETDCSNVALQQSLQLPQMIITKSTTTTTNQHQYQQQQQQHQLVDGILGISSNANETHLSMAINNITNDTIIPFDNKTFDYFTATQKTNSNNNKRFGVGDSSSLTNLDAFLDCRTETIQSTGTEIETKSSEFYGRQQEQQQEEQFIAANDEVIDDVVMVESKDDDANDDDSDYSNRYEPPNDDATTKTSTAVIATTATTISSTLSTDSNGHGLDNIEQHSVQQNIDLNGELTKGLNNNNYNRTTTTAAATAVTSSVDKTTTVGGLMMVNNNILCHHNNHIVGSGLGGSDQYKLGCDLLPPTPTAMPAMTMTTTTYNVPLKETHIFTPSKSDTAIAKTTTTTTTPPIDFDYEIASAGIIIDETVVKKEYRDIEYNPPYDLEILPSSVIKPPPSSSSTANIYLDPPEIKGDDNGVDDDFSDFQSVPIQKPQDHKLVNNSAPVFGEQMILSPAILLPQAISLTTTKKTKPSIEWGESANTNINPDELARIEELFPQPKIGGALGKSKENTNQGSPVHQQQQQEYNLPQAPTISAAVAQNHAEGGGDDDWSDFVSVPITSSNGGFVGNQKQQISNNNNNNGNFKTSKLMQGGRMMMTMGSPHHQKFNVLPTNKSSIPKSSSLINTGVDGATDAAASGDADEWSDFVSSAPPVSVPLSQFNSATWQRANFYNNPMSLYQHNQQQHHAHNNLVPNSLASTKYQQQQQQQQHNNNNNNNYSKHYNNYKNNNINHHNANRSNPQQKQQQKLQQIHIMHDFSTAPTAETSHQHQIYQQQHHHYTQQLQLQLQQQQQQQQKRNNHHHHQQQQQYQQSSIGQIGKTRVPPRISLIPDLSFMAPALPTNAGAFMSSLPKPSFSAKK